MKKRMFQILDEMNVNDGDNNTETLGVCNQFVSGNSSKSGDRITMGAPIGTIQKLMKEEYIPVLLLVDKKEYDRLSKKVK